METLIYLILQMELFVDTDISEKWGVPLNDLLVNVQNSSEKKNKHRWAINLDYGCQTMVCVQVD